MSIANAEYRSYNGTGNNRANPLAGSAWTPFLQNHTIAKTATYPEQQQSIVAISCPISPPPANSWAAGRCVSNIAMSYDTPVNNTVQRQEFVSTTFRTHMVTHFAHYVALNLIATAPNTAVPVQIPFPPDDASYQSPGSFVLNSSTPIPFQSTPDTMANSSSTPSNNKSVRSGVNMVTSFLDQSALYGSSEADVLRLREPSGCRMRTKLDAQGYEFPPRQANNPNMYDLGRYSEKSSDIFSATFATLFIREHNSYCTNLTVANPGMDPNIVFEKTRAYMIALLQRITFTEYLANVLGTTPPAYSGYNPNLFPGIDSMFATSFFRYGHTELPEAYQILNKQNQLIEILSFRDTRTRKILEDFGFENIARLLARQAQEEVDIYYADETRNYFSDAGAPLDLAMLDVLRGRDRLLPKYNEARAIFNLPNATTWADISSNKTVQATLQRLYATVSDVEMTIGALCEDHDLPNSSLGPLFRAGIMAQFVAIRDSDRFWYEAPGVLDDGVLQLVQSTALRDLFLRHFNDKSTLPESIWMYKDEDNSQSTSSGIQFNSNYKVSWSLKSQSIDFELSFTGPVGWFGMGLSPTPGMGGAQFFIVQHESSNSDNLVLDAYSSDGDKVIPKFQRNVIPQIIPPTGNGPLVVKFTRTLTVQDNVKITEANINVLYASSDAKRIGYHQGSRGSHEVNFYNQFDSGEMSNSPRTTHKWHGIGMFLCWAVVFPASIFIVKYQKHRFGNAISLHRHIQLLTGFSITSLAAAAIATASPSMNQAHKIMGLTILASVIGQLGLGIAAIYTLGQLESANKGFAVVIKWMHRVLGTGVLLLAWVNIYFGLVAYNAHFTMIVAYIVYIVLLIVGIGVYHYRWSHEGKTVRGDSRILVKNFLMGEGNEKDGKSDESKQPLLSLPKITWDIVNTRVNSGAKLVVVDDYVFDIREWIPSHPGGAKVLERVIGTDITIDFYGHSGSSFTEAALSSALPEKQSLPIRRGSLRRVLDETIHLNQLTTNSSTSSLSSIPQVLHPYQLVGQLKYTRMITNLPESLKVFKDAQRRDPRRFSMPDSRKSFYGDMMRHSQAIDELPEDVELGGENNEDDDGVIIDSHPSVHEKKSLLERLFAWFEGLAHMVDRYNIKSHGGAVNFGVGDGDDETQMTRALATHAHSARAIQRLARYCIGVIDVDNSSGVALRRQLTTKPDPSRKIFKRYMLTSKTTLTSALASRPVRRFTFKPCTALGKHKKTKRNSAKKMFMPGDFIEIQCAVEGQVLTRSYTPIEGNMDEEFAIYVKIYPDGMVSRFLDMQYPGYEIRIRGPFDLSEKYGNDPSGGLGPSKPRQASRLLLNPQRDDGRWNQLLIIAGGTGLTPALQMIHHHIRNQNLETEDPKEQSDIFLLCLNRSHRDVISGQYMDKLVTLSGKRLRVDYGVNEASEKTPGVYKGHLTHETLRRWFLSVYNRRKALAVDLSLIDNGSEITSAPDPLPSPRPGQVRFEDEMSDQKLQVAMNSFIAPGIRVMLSGTPGMMDTALDFLEKSHFPPERCLVLH
ncbi:hypothetical protein BGZ59_002935 [Podila verticillata]|nr:hypothetical protein BGZ59_002935 [Podila verticillata]